MANVTADSKKAACIRAFASVRTGTIVYNVLSTATHATTLQDRDRIQITAALGGQSAIDFINCLATGSVTLKDHTRDKLKSLVGDVDMAGALVTLANAVV